MPVTAKQLDQVGDVIDLLVQKRRNKHAENRFFHKLLKVQCAFFNNIKLRKIFFNSILILLTTICGSLQVSAHDSVGTEESQTEIRAHSSDERFDTDLYSSILWGDGRGGDEEDRSMQGRAFELRFGKEIRKNTRIDIVHYNEGHPQNNHRDGFALQGVYRFSPSKSFAMEFALGPYLGFNTTTHFSSGGDDAIQLNDKDVGVLGSVGLLYFPRLLGKSAHLRLQYNHVEMPGAPDSDALLAGIGFDIESKGDTGRSENQGTLEIAALLSHFITNHTVTSSSQGFHMEIRKEIRSHLGVSIGYLKEGDDELVQRNGIPLQFWYSASIGAKWSLAAGAGPYFSRDKDHSGVDVNGIISLEAKREFPKDINLVFRFNRIMDINNNPLENQENDRDVFEIGLSKEFH